MVRYITTLRVRRPKFQASHYWDGEGTRLDVLGPMTVRLINILKNENICSVEELESLSDEDWRLIPNAGAMMKAEARAAVKRYREA